MLCALKTQTCRYVCQLSNANVLSKVSCNAVSFTGKGWDNSQDSNPSIGHHSTISSAKWAVVESCNFLSPRDCDSDGLHMLRLLPSENSPVLHFCKSSASPT